MRSFSLLVGLIILLTAMVSAFCTRLVNRYSSSLNAKALIVQNKGGGHGELGYQLAKLLSRDNEYTRRSGIDSVTILQDDTANFNKEPFCSYQDLNKVHLIKAPISDQLSIEDLQSRLGGETFDYIWDNATKDPDSGIAQALCSLGTNSRLYIYVSSAGMYNPDSKNSNEPLSETSTPVKESSGQRQFELYAADKVPLVSFRPQYIYGPKANKHDYLDWFFDRLVRGLPLPIPFEGDQLVSLTHAADVAEILATPLLNEEACKGQIFNCGTDQLVTYNEVAQMCAKAAGIKDFDIEHYEADLLGKGTFPFRLTSFYVKPDLIKQIGWSGPKHSLETDLEWYYQDYLKRGGPDKQMSLIKDWEIVVGHKTPKADHVGSIYEKYDPIIINN